MAEASRIGNFAFLGFLSVFAGLKNALYLCESFG